MIKLVNLQPQSWFTLQRLFVLNLVSYYRWDFGILSRYQIIEPHVLPAFAITYFCNHCNIRFENTWKYVDTLTLFSKNLDQRSLTPRWPLTPCLLRSHVWLYPRIIVSKSHDNTSMYVDTLINFAKYHIHTHTYYVHTTYYVHSAYRMSDHIVSYWTQFKRDKNYSGIFYFCQYLHIGEGILSFGGDVFRLY